jgi:glycolate oxidase iron-sulfur subunit
MPLAYPEVHRATLRVLTQNGCQVVAPRGQLCCGALHAHNGDRRTAVRLARANVDAFLTEDYDAIIVNSAGCGAAMKEYGRLLGSEPAYAAGARDFSRRVRDIHEFLVDLPFKRPAGPLDVDVTYQDPCHLAHVQRITQAPRDILRAIPGLRLVEMEHADRCCGSAGVYALTQVELSRRLLDDKVRAVRSSGAGVVVTANPGCMAQLEAGIRHRRLNVRVAHTVQLLDQAYRSRGAGPP